MSWRGLRFHSFFLSKVTRLPKNIFDFKMSDQTHKVVFVELEEVGDAAPNRNLQVKFQTSDAQTYDRTLVLNVIKVKKMQTCCHVEK